LQDSIVKIINFIIGNGKQTFEYEISSNKRLWQLQQQLDDIKNKMKKQDKEQEVDQRSLKADIKSKFDKVANDFNEKLSKQND
jgi:hypothetical protein